MSDSPKAVARAYKATSTIARPADPSTPRPKDKTLDNRASIMFDQVAVRVVKFAKCVSESFFTVKNTIEGSTAGSTTNSGDAVKEKDSLKATASAQGSVTTPATGGRGGYRHQGQGQGLDNRLKSNTGHKRDQGDMDAEARLVNERAHFDFDKAETDGDDEVTLDQPATKRVKLGSDEDDARNSTAIFQLLGPPVDPYSVLPLEIWYEILSCLRLSEMTKASLISKAWLEGTRSHPIWRKICVSGKLGAPKKKYKTHMALACANSYWVCEFCLSHTRGHQRRANIPLPVPIDEYGGELWMLCLSCRNKYFWTHVERPGKFTDHRFDQEPHSEMCMRHKYFLRLDGGFVGARARWRKTAATRRLLFTARSKETWNSRRPSKVARM
ncbi:hypothetical protein BGX29_011780 [Mortierella sp. GBA35]|nr:hypothetical protein BGX29_011780 [Mortierella sp. GBA35]